MSYGASIYSHVYNPPIAAEGLCEISREQGWRPSTIVKSAPSQLEIETQLVMDQLLRECFTRKSPRGTGRIGTPDTHPRPPGEGKFRIGTDYFPASRRAGHAANWPANVTSCACDWI